MIKAFFSAVLATVRRWALSRVADVLDWAAINLWHASERLSEAADAVRAKA